MTLLDRMLIRGYVKAYLVCLVSLLSLYVVVDLFTHADDFFESSHGLSALLKHVGSYYGFRLSQIFDRLCEAILLMAAMFTVAMMQRSNELLPLLSAGLSTHRVVCPVLVSAAAMLFLTALNQEFIIPRIDSAKFFLHTREVTFDTITRPRTWFIYASTVQLLEELSKPDSTRLASMAVLFHTRLTRPILAMILVLMGLSVILRDQNRNVFISAGVCLVICAMFFGVSFACKHLGDNEYLAPALAAWLPVIAFG